MKGTILSVSDSEVLIRCADGNKHKCPLSEIKSVDVKPRPGDDVDFETSEGNATEVYILRAASKVDQLASKATEKASQAVNLAKSHLTDENKEKILALGASASESAQKIGGELKDKAGAFIGNLQSGQSKAAISQFSGIQNKFIVGMLCTFLLVSFFSLFKIMGQGITFYQGVDSNLLAYALIGAIVVAAMGINVMVYRALVVIALLSILIPTFQLYTDFSDGMQAASEFGFRPKKMNLSNMLGNMATSFFYIFIIGTVMTAITLIPGLYKTKTPSAPASNVESN